MIFYDFSHVADFANEANFKLIMESDKKTEIEWDPTGAWGDYVESFYVLPPALIETLSEYALEEPHIKSLADAALNANEVLFAFGYQGYPYWVNGNKISPGDWC